MDLRWPWLAVGLAVVVVAALIAWSVLAGRRRARGRAPLIAHSDRVRRLPRFRALARQQSYLATWQTLAILVAAAGAILLAARPQATAVTQESHSTRDIVLCLDASASMFDEDVQVVEAFSDIVHELDGERISLVLWSDAAVTVFPLTDDYGYVQDQLREASRAFAVQDPDYIAGTYLGRERASLISDGIVSCVQRFDRTDEKRGRAVIVASDNDPQGGPPVYTLTGASRYAKAHDVKLYGIGSADLTYEPTKRRTFEQAVTATGGTFSLLGQDGTTDTIVQGIHRLESEKVTEPPRVTEVERPVTAISIAGAGVLMLVLGWAVALIRRLGGGAR